MDDALELPGASPTPTRSADRLVERGAVLNGTMAGLLVLTPVSIAVSVLAHVWDGFESSGWEQLFVLAIFAGYFVAGWVAGRAAPRAPLTNGTLAALGAIAAWIPLRIVIWLIRGNGRGLVAGHDPVLSAPSLFGSVVVATGFGMLGAWLRSRRTARTAEPA